MLRELVEGLETLTQAQLGVLVLEDLHWSDPSTVDVLSLLARRREAAPPLLLGTYRPVELMLRAHPLKPAKAEVYRLQGVLLQQQTVPDTAQAEACFTQALTIAPRQQARSWELRAAMSLSRLWQQQGKPAEVHALLVPACGWFTAGFDTADLQEARALLEELV
jgi:hypothetical protein